MNTIHCIYVELLYLPFPENARDATLVTDEGMMQPMNVMLLLVGMAFTDSGIKSR